MDTIKRLKIAFQYITYLSFNFVWVFKSCLNRHGCNVDDVSKIGYSSPSSNKGILK